jgi:glycerophosphoryl diester phosphodiesterase
MPENSRAAFQAAIGAGYGIELDVQASIAGFAFVFHDEKLDRLTGETGYLRDREFAEVERIRLKGSSETIPELLEVLRLVQGRAPLLIEVKGRGGEYHQLCHHVASSLQDYPGPVGIMSFDPRVGHWFSLHHPAILRGLVVTEERKGGWKGRIERLVSLWWARADFLACDIRDLPSTFATDARRRGLSVYTWTVRSAADRARAAAHADQIIFEAPPG